MKKATVCVAMSGGVDSSVVAGLLVQEGYEVVGVTMQIWQESQRDPRHAGCCSLGAVEDARRVARRLGIPHYVVNFKEEFRRAVIVEFIEEYSRGRTPNPCVTCNQTVKFSVLWEKAEELGCSLLATGHYARIEREDSSGRFLLKRALSTKDQSYALYALSQEQLRRTIFPLGAMRDKSQVRELARQFGLPVALKPDSQEICFVSEAGGYREFLHKSRPEAFSPGEIVDTAGRKVGVHSGVAGYTVGQRRGLGVARGKPLYVVAIRPERNEVVVGDREETEQREVGLQDVVWSSGQPAPAPLGVQAKVRYNMPPRAAVLHPEHRLVFDEPVNAVTPGQIAVAYDGDTVVAGGKIR